MSLIKLAVRNRIFWSLGIEAKSIKNLLPLGLENDELHFNKHLNMHNPRANGVSPGRGLLIPHGYLHPGKCEHSEVQSSSMIAGASLWLIGGPH